MHLVASGQLLHHAHSRPAVRILDLPAACAGFADTDEVGALVARLLDPMQQRLDAKAFALGVALACAPGRQLDSGNLHGTSHGVAPIEWSYGTLSQAAGALLLRLPAEAQRSIKILFSRHE